MAWRPLGRCLGLYFNQAQWFFILIYIRHNILSNRFSYFVLHFV